MLEAQKPAEGILKVNEWGTSVMYKAVCECGQDDCTHTIDIEAEQGNVTVIVYTTQTTNYWTETFEKKYDIDNIYWQEVDWRVKDFFNSLIRKIKLTWTLWTKGYVEYQSSIIMKKQTALNYAETLKQAVADVQKIEAEVQNKKVSKIAEQGDCV